MTPQAQNVVELRSTHMRTPEFLAVFLLPAVGMMCPMRAAAAESLQPCDPMPAILHAEQPEYPNYATRPAVEGSVTLHFTIGRDGSVSAARVVANEPADTADWFNAPALAAIAKFRFATVPAPCVGRLKMSFRIRGEKTLQ
jgi:TonB family protein